MDIDEIKNLMESDNGKLIVVENGKPVFVVMSFEDYKNILDRKNNEDKEYVNDEQDIEDSQSNDVAEEGEQGIEFPGQLEY